MRDPGNDVDAKFYRKQNMLLLKTKTLPHKDENNRTLLLITKSNSETKNTPEPT